jgi:tetratricopeptide (TPR) repeat protein
MKNGACFFTLLLIFLASCQDKKTELNLLIARLNQPDSLETQENVARLNQALNTYLEKYPGDKHEADYLYLAAQTCNETGRHEKATEQFSLFRERYANDKRAGDALFLIAFIQENKLGNLDEALQNYEAFIIEYPDNPLIPVAQASIAHLGKSPEEIYRSFSKEAVPEKQAAD